MPTVNSGFSIPEELYNRLVNDGATEMIPEIVTYQGANGPEYAIFIRGKYANSPDTLDSACPRPCPYVDEEGGGDDN